MRAFFLPCRGDVNAPARSVEQPAASHVPSSLEQPADPLTSINALTVWLKAQGDDAFFLTEVDAQITFTRDAEGRVDGLVLHQGGRDMPAKRQ